MRPFGLLALFTISAANGCGGDPAGTSEATGGPATSGGTTIAGCDAADVLCAVPADEWAPQVRADGLPRPLPGVHDDQGVAPGGDGVRGLIGLPTQDQATLERRVWRMYDPQDAEFGEYMTAAEWAAGHAPAPADVELVAAWLRSRGLRVDFAASNRLLLRFSGDVAAFNAAFATTLHVCLRERPQQGLPPVAVYCADGPTALPGFVAARTTGLLTADLPAATGSLAGEVGGADADPPRGAALTPERVAAAYELDELHALGFRGAGQRIGVVAAGHYHTRDLTAFWRAFAVKRAAPTAIEVMEPAVVRDAGAIQDVQWVSSLAPGADVTVYVGPDARDTSLIYVFNEAIGRADIDVLADSFARRGAVVAAPVRAQYDHAALMAAALGITVVAAGGDATRPGTPCGSSFVTCVGGTDLVTDAAGEVLSETAWSGVGPGESSAATASPAAPGARWAVCDVALSAGEPGYWVRLYDDWYARGGTAFAAPVFAATIAVINDSRADRGLARVGFFNRALYLDAAVQASFRDVSGEGAGMHDAGPGWDFPTGWGAPRAKLLADALP